MRLCWWVFLLLVLVALLVLGLFLLIPFPLAIYQDIVNSQVILQTTKSGQPTKATSYWENLPAIEYYDFYFFNVTNPDDVIYNGAMPALVEVGPYSYAETEFKEWIDWYKGGNEVYYANNKSWVFNPSTSCSNCNYDDVLMLPNAAYMSVLYMQTYKGIPKVLTPFLDMFLLLIGEYPMSAVPMKGVTFEGYPDPLIDFVNSNFTQTILKKLGLPPDAITPITTMGYFPKYNHTHDGDYNSLTGKDNSNNLGLIQSWCNTSMLPWWGDEYSQDISGSGDGSFQKPNLQKGDTLKQFQSFACRSYFLHYDSDANVGGISAYRFKMNTDTYNTNLEYNKGYRYENKELVDWFPNWPCGSNHTYAPDWPGCADVDCTQRVNFCNTCCDGSYYHGVDGENATIYLPEGIIPLRCLPGQYVDLPFAGFLSPPHFAWSPEEVTSSLYGLNPDPEGKHYPATFDIQPNTGSTVGGTFRMQLSVPIYNNPGYTQLSTTKNYFIPTFWLEVRVSMYDYAHNYILFNTVTLPQIILGVGIGLTAVSILCGLLLVFCWVRTKKRETSLTKEVTSSNIWS